MKNAAGNAVLQSVVRMILLKNATGNAVLQTVIRMTLVLIATGNAVQSQSVMEIRFGLFKDVWISRPGNAVPQTPQNAMMMRCWLLVDAGNAVQPQSAKMIRSSADGKCV